MAKMRFLYNNLFDLSAAVLTVSSEAAGFEKENLQHIWHTRPWRSTGVADEWVKLNLGSAMGIKAFGIQTHDFPNDITIHIQANAADAWGAPTLNTALTWTEDRIVKFWDTPQSFQWWRFRMQAGGAPAYRSIGRPFLGSFFEMDRNYKRLQPTFIDPSVIKKSSGGQISADIKPHFSLRKYSFRIIKASDIDDLETIFGIVGQAVPYFICEEPGADPHLTFYYVRNTTPWGFKPITKTEYYDFVLSVETMR